MSSKQIQIAVLAGMIVAGGMFFRDGMPRLANDAGVLYLRAEYKLATGDTGSAMRLMQRAAVSRQTQAVTRAVEPAEKVTTDSCPDSTPVTPVVAKRNASHTSTKASTLQFAGLNHHVTSQVLSFATLKQTDVAFVTSKTWAKIEARNRQREEKYAESMRLLEARLKNLPIPEMPAVPAIVTSVPLD